MILIFVRVLLTWFSGVNFGRPYQMISAVTDPYLNYFRRFGFLRLGGMDFSPLAGILVLVVTANIFQTLAVYGEISLGIILAISVRALWSAVSFLLTLLIVLIVIRFVASLIRANTVHPFIRTLDYILTPFLSWIHRRFFPKRFLTLPMGLAIAGASLILLSLIGNFLILQLVLLLRSIPF